MELNKREQHAKVQLRQDEVLAILALGETSAHEMLWDKAPDAARRFDRATKALQKTLEEVRKHFPDACYYSASDTLCLMLGDSHSDKDQPQQKLVAMVAVEPLIGGGDW